MIKITGLDPSLYRFKKLRVGFKYMVSDSIQELMSDVVDTAMENLRNNLIGETTSHGQPQDKLTDNLDLWDYEKIGVSEGYVQWKLWNRSEHAAPVECGSRTPIKPKKGNYLYLGKDVLVEEVRGQEPKHFLGDALYYQRDRWARNLKRYVGTRVNGLIR